jgi:hypothetical protein
METIFTLVYLLEHLILINLLSFKADTNFNEHLEKAQKS